MKLNFDRTESIDLSTVNYGDVLILSNGSMWLVVADTNGGDFRGINLVTYKTSEWSSKITTLVDRFLGGAEVIRIIKSEDLVMEVK